MISAILALAALALIVTAVILDPTTRRRK